MSGLEDLLKLIGQAGPGGWYPQAFAESSGVSLDSVYYLLEHLYLDGLVEKGDSDPDRGSGVVLTARGAEVLQDADALERLRQGKSVDPDSHGARVREVLRRPHRLFVTWLLILTNLAIFGYSVYLASQVKLAGSFFGNPTEFDPRLLPILERSGALDARLLIKGDWWRLLTATFIHMHGLLLLLNLWMLYGTCRRTERLWGWERTLAIFLLAAFGSNCEQLAQVPAVEVQKQIAILPVMGGWGAICGLIAAEAVWMLLSKRHLPRSAVRRWRSGMIGTILMLTFVGLFFLFQGAPAQKQAGWGMLCGDFGGAVAGALAGLFLYWQRFGPDPWRWLGFLAVVPLPWVGMGVLDRARVTHPVWIKLEENEFDSLKIINRGKKLRKDSRNWYDTTFFKILLRDEHNWKARNPKEMDEALKELEPIRRKAVQLQSELGGARRRFRNRKILETIDDASAYFKVQDKLLGLAEQLLRDRDEITPEDNKELKRLEDELQWLPEVHGGRAGHPREQLVEIFLSRLVT